ncbi:hypothetical protein NDU88_005930 [Pleurodeles waltl]|uniref:Uncharacterized protein n=1 Tax=Pleurodeles waltl TaxID=8319 RepID=A0AAV7PH33_PLEWA|nr:hypothetical protein NDU88_005930 [Pleurodeles waltl]
MLVRPQGRAPVRSARLLLSAARPGVHVSLFSRADSASSDLGLGPTGFGKDPHRPQVSVEDSRGATTALLEPEEGGAASAWANEPTSAGTFKTPRQHPGVCELEDEDTRRDPESTKSLQEDEPDRQWHQVHHTEDEGSNYDHGGDPRPRRTQRSTADHALDQVQDGKREEGDERSRGCLVCSVSRVFSVYGV